MSTLYFLIPIALIFCVIALKLVLWAIQSGQYSDLERDANMIFEDTNTDTGPEDTNDH